MEYVIDAKNQKLGRLAAKIAGILQGKIKAGYTPRLLSGNRVVVKNIRLIAVSGGKEKQKTYYRHTGYIGHLKEKKYREVFEKNPDRVLRHAVEGMLPKNRLQPKMLKNLIIER
ncbi:MAG: 50S ribosomal protein L13 [Patescibacteria group bacterium]